MYTFVVREQELEGEADNSTQGCGKFQTRLLENPTQEPLK